MIRGLIGVCVGAAVGVAIGIGTGNTNAGIGVGAGLAIVFGWGAVLHGWQPHRTVRH